MRFTSVFLSFSLLSLSSCFLFQGDDEGGLDSYYEEYNDDDDDDDDDDASPDNSGDSSEPEDSCVLVTCSGTDNGEAFTYPEDKGLCADDGDYDDLEGLQAQAELYCELQEFSDGIDHYCDISCDFTADSCSSHENIVSNKCDNYTEGSTDDDEPPEVHDDPCELTLLYEDACEGMIDFITALITDAEGEEFTGYVSADHRSDYVGVIAVGTYRVESEWVYLDGEIYSGDDELECDGERNIDLTFLCS